MVSLCAEPEGSAGEAGGDAVLCQHWSPGCSDSRIDNGP